MVAWIVCGTAIGAYEAAVRYALERVQFKQPIAKFQLTQEKLSRMLALCEINVNHLVLISRLHDEGKATMG